MTEPRPTRELVPVDPDSCPECSTVLDVTTIGEPALFYHGGYGATRETVVVSCRCGWWRVRSVSETRPEEVP